MAKIEDSDVGLNIICAEVKTSWKRVCQRLQRCRTGFPTCVQRPVIVWVSAMRRIAVCAEMTLRTALVRTESIGSHYREDYSERGDKNWLKWTIVKQEAGKMVVSTEPLLIYTYKFKL